MELNWYNFLGDKGTLRVGPFKYIPEIKRDIQIDILEKPARLFVEEPHTVQCRVTNCGKKRLRLLLGTSEPHMTSIIINGISTLEVGDIEPTESKIL